MPRQTSANCCRAVRLTKVSVCSILNVCRRCSTRAHLSCSSKIRTDSSDCDQSCTVQTQIQHCRLWPVAMYGWKRIVYFTIMRGKSVCLSVCLSAPLAFSLLHGREPRPRRLSPWALGTCPHLASHLPPRAA